LRIIRTSEESRAKDLGLLSEERRKGKHGPFQLESTELAASTEAVNAFVIFLWHFDVSCEVGRGGRGGRRC